MLATFYGILKKHEPEKSFPKRAVVLNIGSPSYGTSKCLVKITAYLNKKKRRILSSPLFVEEAKEWNV